MAILLRFLSILVFPLLAHAAATPIQGVLGERDGGLYAGPWRPEHHFDEYFGRKELSDDLFEQNFFFPYIWREAPEVSRYLAIELSGANTCPNEVLSQQQELLRYGYRLVAMSYLLEMLDALHADAQLVKKPQACSFKLQDLLKDCHPQSSEMAIFLKGLKAQAPYGNPVIDQTHNYQSFRTQWAQSASRGGEQKIGATRIYGQCMVEGKDCSKLQATEAELLLERACQADKAQLLQICSEKDQIYGLATIPAMTQMLSTSNLMSVYNKEGYGLGCMRRFGQLLSAHERVPGHLRWSLPTARASLVKDYGERYPLGRAFVYGALKEFRDKGLTDVFEAKVVAPVARPVVVAPTPKPESAPVVVAAPKPEAAPVVVEVPKPVLVKKPEVEPHPKSAFLLASEVRWSQSLDRVDVDMLKFRYDYVFNAAEMQLLSDSLKEYTTREALKEMQSFDKLGTKDQPVPLTFVKYLIDSENHQGLYNLAGVLGDSFWMANDVDVKWKAGPEYVELKNDGSTGNQWQLYIMKAR